MKTPLGMEVDLGRGHIVLDGNPATPPLFGPCLLWPRSLISATAELLLVLFSSHKSCCQPNAISFTAFASCQFQNHFN